VGVLLARLVLGIVLCVVFLVCYHMGFSAMLWSAFVTTAAVGLYVAWLFRRYLRYWLDGSLLRKMFTYSWPLNLSTVAVLVLDLGDRYVLQRTVSLDELGIYGLAYKLGMTVGLVSTMFNQFWKPQMFSLVRGAVGERLNARVFTYYILTLAGVCLMLTVLLSPLLRVFAGRQFAPAAVYIPWIACIYLVRSAGDFFRNAFNLNRRTWKDTQITYPGMVVCVVGYLTLIPRYRLWGAIAATGIAFAGMLVVSIWQAQKVQHFDFEWSRLASVVGVAALLMSAYCCLKPESLAWQLAMAAGVLLGYGLVLWVLGLVQQDEKDAVRYAVSLLRGKVSGSSVGGVDGRQGASV
jgi:O-antigen/teichoic acid export membrane protein